LDKRRLKANPVIVVNATKQSLQWLIEYGHKGAIYMDSSARHKSNCNAPVTALMVTNEFGAGLMGALCVTSDITSSTLEVILLIHCRFVSRKLNRQWNRKQMLL
jgi:hypothetical protein